MLRVDSPKEISGVRPQNPLHGDRLGRRDIDLDSARAKRCRDFKTMKLAPITTARRASRHLATIAQLSASVRK